MKKIYPSSSAFMWGDIVMTEYDSGCLRNILIKSYVTTPDIDPLYMEVGALHEDNYEAEALGDTPHEKEVPFRTEVLGDVVLSGRMDFTSEGMVHECKGTVSKSTAQGWLKGQYKLNHLAQIVAYMVQTGVSNGKIACGFYTEVDGKVKQSSQKIFEVTVTDDGAILVDGKSTGYTVADQLRHRYEAARTLASNQFPDRPAKWNQSWSSPCGFCMFRATCDKYDNGEIETLDEIIDSAQEDVQNHKPRAAKIIKE